ncbi:MAG: carbohydrate ABC transporter permease [Candidatus Izemoplasmatales bacterium]|jgi:multiple sugar transport system permease protein|nr:carbohydrate ABC transporter permease [Candidatus Izemoplasmatales bacterium]NLF48364.1 carbohydrate ABC transporter permease [Acholeplasmataceae bacterium]MDD4354681.1 carbohydrate ABC transporter permease [Candidatus Izemoplasmatales bacterium]MDD4988144.1 carbohydrate ABC transporter permease [Candidatus Izemoplasmatales bacterium]MDD5601671.1 carbohydrate ABC transporter permease [Candidatus Izemoplasmatales bacterium]
MATLTNRYLSVNERARRQKRLIKFALYLLLVSIAIILIFPYFYMVMKSLMTTEEVVGPVKLFPSVPQFINYIELFTESTYFKATLNSLFIIGFNVIAVPLSASMIAFSFAKLRWKGRKVMFAIMMSTMMLPATVTQIPLFIMYSKMGWIDTLFPFTIPNLFGGGAFYIFLLRQFMMGIPKDLVDAAKIDGAGTFRVYWQIILPLCKPVLIYLMVNIFIAYWGDFYGPLIYMSSSDAPRTLAYVIFLESAESNAATQMAHIRMAGGVFMSIIPAILFTIFQKQLIEGVTLTGSKG